VSREPLYILTPPMISQLKLESSNFACR